MSRFVVEQPLVSVVVPIYNRARLVPRVVHNLQTQTVTNWELLFVDDGSDDEPEGAVARHGVNDTRIRFIARKANGGPAAARNAGLDAARGTFVALLDSDDDWMPQKLERQLEAIRYSEARLAFCVTRTIVEEAGGRQRVLPSRGIASGERWPTYLYIHNEYAQASSFLFHRHLKVRFDEQLRQYEDHDFFLSAGAAGARYVYVETPLVIQHRGGLDSAGARDSVPRADVFLSRAAERGLMTPVEELAFQLRCLPLQLARHDRKRAWNLFVKSLGVNALPHSAKLKLLLALVGGPTFYERLRRTTREQLDGRRY